MALSYSVATIVYIYHAEEHIEVKQAHGCEQNCLKKELPNAKTDGEAVKTDTEVESEVIYKLYKHGYSRPCIHLSCLTQSFLKYIIVN